MGDTRRRQILEGLLKAVAQHGLSDCNMTEVAQAAGVSRGILHYYFKNKHEMIGALVEHLKDSNLMSFRSEVDQYQDPAEQLRASLWYPVQAFGKSGGAPLAKVWIEFWGLAANHPEVHSFILQVQQSLRAHYRDIIKRGIETGVFLADADPDRVAALILASLEGTMLQWHFNPEEAFFAGQLEILERMLACTLRQD